MIDDGRVLAIAARPASRVAAYRAPEGTHSVTVDSTAVGYATLYLGADGRDVLVSSPSTEHGDRLNDRSASRRGRSRPAPTPTSTGTCPSTPGPAPLNPRAPGSAPSTSRAAAIAFDAGTCDRVARLVGGHSGLVNQLDVHPDGLLVSAGIDGTVRTWDVDAEAGAEDADTDALCETFGDRIDEQSWQLAMGGPTSPPRARRAKTKTDRAPLEVDNKLVTPRPVTVRSPPTNHAADRASTRGLGPSRSGPPRWATASWRVRSETGSTR